MRTTPLTPAGLRRRQFVAAALALPMTGLTRAQPAPARLRLIGETRIAHRMNFRDTVVGGLSGIDHDPATGLFHLLSDDRSELGPARMYTARIPFDATGMGMPQLESMTNLRRPDGATFARREVDPESIRWRAGTGTLLWSSEGDIKRGDSPFVREMRPDGSHLRQLELPAMFNADPSGQRGPRDNLGFEGLALSQDARSAWVAMEAPLIEDGPVPRVGGDAGACRFTQVDLASGRPLRQIAYRPDPIPQAPRPPAGFADNGVSEILMLDQRRMWVLERAYMHGVGNSLRIHEIDTGPDLPANAPFEPAAVATPVAKSLVLDFSTLGLAKLDNTEGMCFGPLLAVQGGGAPRRSLVCVSDDNFNPGQVTQILAFEVIE